MSLSDSLALVDFFYAMNGEKWVQPRNLHLPVSTWHGIELSPLAEGEPQRVTGMDIGVSSSAWSGIGEVPSVFDDNNVAGILPASLGRLSALQRFQIHADIERIEDFLGQLPDLEYLTVYNSDRSAAAFSLGRHPELRLHTANDKLKKIFLTAVTVEALNSVWDYPSLNTLQLWWCGLPENYVIMGNAMSAPSLARLDFTGLRNVAISENLYNLGADITHFSITDTHYSSSKPELNRLITAFPNMVNFRMDMDGATIPQSITTWTSLERLNLSWVTGTLPVGLFELPVLHTLSLSGSNLTGTIPKEWVEGKELNIDGTQIVIE